MTDDTKATGTQIDKFSDRKWIKRSYQDDGTYIEECSNNGEIWESCEEE